MRNEKVFISQKKGAYFGGEKRIQLSLYIYCRIRLCVVSHIPAYFLFFISFSYDLKHTQFTHHFGMEHCRTSVKLKYEKMIEFYDAQFYVNFLYDIPIKISCFRLFILLLSESFWFSANAHKMCEKEMVP